MGVVKAPFHQVVRVVAVRHGFMAASGTVLVAGFLPLRNRMAAVRVRRRNLDRILIHMIAVRRVHVAFMKIPQLAAVPDGRVPAARAVLVRVSFVFFACHEEFS
jgi:hypothetical protein